MSETLIYPPEQKNGLAFHIATVIGLLSLAALGALRASRSDLGPEFLIYLLPVLAGLVLAPVLAYRAYTLRRGYYALNPEGLGIYWGLRVEEIPMDQILWVRPASEVGVPLSLPHMRWPGSLVGVRVSPGLGPVEYMASGVHTLLVIATPVRLYAVSPKDPQGFLNAYHRCIEMAAIDPLAPRSIYPSFLLARIWAEPLARTLLIAGLGLSFLLLAWVILTIPGRTVIPLGFEPGGRRRDPVPAVRLLLLPVLNSFFLTADMLLGMYFFRWDRTRPLAYLLWGSGAVTALLFLVGLFFILLSR